MLRDSDGQLNLSDGNRKEKTDDEAKNKNQLVQQISLFDDPWRHSAGKEKESIFGRICGTCR